LDHPPRILLLYGSLRDRSFNQLMTEEAARVLNRFGVETKTFNPSGLP
jgi:arsenic resistance protein ArsH